MGHCSSRDQRQLRSRDAVRRKGLPPARHNSRDARHDGRSDTRGAPISPRTASRSGKQVSPVQQQQHAQHPEQGSGPGDGAAALAPSVPRTASSDGEITLRDALPAEIGLDEEELETLREVEERLESNKAQLEYKDRKIVSIQQEVESWAENRRLRKRGTGVQGQGQSANVSAGTGTGAGPSANGREIGEAQMIEELESDVNDIKGARGTIRVLFSSLVASKRTQKQKTGMVKSLQVKFYPNIGQIRRRVVLCALISPGSRQLVYQK